MANHTLQPVVGESVEGRCGPWRVLWGPGDFLIPDVGSFSVNRIVLPILVVADASRDSGYLVVNLEDGFQFAILQGSCLEELEAFKKRVSTAVLVATGRESFCFDCAREAGLTPRSWSGTDCVGCRGPYCRNPFCLRRLEPVCTRDGPPVCRSCRASAELVGGR